MFLKIKGSTLWHVSVPDFPSVVLEIRYWKFPLIDCLWYPGDDGPVETLNMFSCTYCTYYTDICTTLIHPASHKGTLLWQHILCLFIPYSRVSTFSVIASKPH